VSAHDPASITFGLARAPPASSLLLLRATTLQQEQRSSWQQLGARELPGL